jgi:glutaredoxin
MNKPILFSLEKCVKCMQIKELIKDKNDFEIITYPHDINDWSDEELSQAKQYDVFEDLHQTAPILVVDGGKKIGYLRIKKWLQDNNFLS